MKPRPPSLRDKRRYILARIVPQWKCPEAKELFLSIQEAVNSLRGDATAADIQMAVIYSDREFAIIRCGRGTEDVLEQALATVFCIGDDRVAVRSIAISGTILALKKRIGQIKQEEIPEQGEIALNGRVFDSYHYPGRKVDLLEKGFKSRELLFLTEEDIEEM
jgi:ribonuclease P/MRP protein subunit POP5